MFLQAKNIFFYSWGVQQIGEEGKLTRFHLLNKIKQLENRNVNLAS